MKNFFEKLRVEDWVVVWVSIPLLLLAALIPADLPSVPATLVGEVAWYNIGLLFAIVLVVLYVGCLLLRRPLKGLLPSLVVVFAVSLLAQVVAKIPAVSYYGFESVFFSVLFGLVIRNVWRVPAWMKPAIQGEFFIKIGVVCLGATILFSDVMKSGVFGLVQACLVVAVVWFFALRFSRRMKVDERSAMILASGLSICGVSASITAARVVGGDDRKLSYIVSLVLIVVVPMIYLMPWLANLILPHLFAPEVAEEVAGAWIGGTIDTTSGVAASSMIVGEGANQWWRSSLRFASRPAARRAGRLPRWASCGRSSPSSSSGSSPRRSSSASASRTVSLRWAPRANCSNRAWRRCSRRSSSRWPSSASVSTRVSRTSSRRRTATSCGRSSWRRHSISS